MHELGSGPYLAYGTNGARDIQAAEDLQIYGLLQLPPTQ